MTDRNAAIQAVRQAFDAERLTINALDDGSGVLLDIEGEQLLTLNSTGMKLVQAIEAGAGDIEALRDMLCAEFEVDEKRAEADAAAFVEEVARAL